MIACEKTGRKGRLIEVEPSGNALAAVYGRGGAMLDGEGLSLSHVGGEERGDLRRSKHSPN